MTARRPLLPIVLLVIALFAACGKGGDDPALSGNPVDEPETTTTTAAGGDDPGAEAEAEGGESDDATTETSAAE